MSEIDRFENYGVDVNYSDHSVNWYLIICNASCFPLNQWIITIQRLSQVEINTNAMMNWRESIYFEDYMLSLYMALNRCINIRTSNVFQLKKLCENFWNISQARESTFVYAWNLGDSNRKSYSDERQTLQFSGIVCKRLRLWSGVAPSTTIQCCATRLVDHSSIRRREIPFIRTM